MPEAVATPVKAEAVGQVTQMPRVFVLSVGLRRISHTTKHTV